MSDAHSQSCDSTSLPTDELILVEYTTDYDLLRTALAAGDVTVELDAIDARGLDNVRLLLWATGGDFGRFEAKLTTDATAISSNLVSVVSKRRLYSVLVDGDLRAIYDELVVADAAICQATGTADGWFVRLRFPGRNALVGVRRWYADEGYSFRVETLGFADPSPRDAPLDLTSTQASAIALAYESGYFEIPRRVSMGEIAQEVGITSQAFSERLRRGCSKIIEQSGLV
ncbi:MAG: helix-turn-helix domain-containing protein [Halobacteriota archaeon]